MADPGKTISDDRYGQQQPWVNKQSRANAEDGDRRAGEMQPSRASAAMLADIVGPELFKAAKTHLAPYRPRLRQTASVVEPGVAPPAGPSCRWPAPAAPARDGYAGVLESTDSAILLGTVRWQPPLPLRCLRRYTAAPAVRPALRRAWRRRGRGSRRAPPRPLPRSGRGAPSRRRSC